MGIGPDDEDAAVVPSFDAGLAAEVNAALIGELDEGLAIDPTAPFGDERRLFAALYLRHRHGITLRVGRYLRDKRDIEEVVQETFLRLFLALPDLDNEAAAVAWCRRTSTNLCIDRYRAAQRRPTLVDLENVIDDLADDKPVDGALLLAEDAVIVRQALSLLSPQHRAALIKREIEEKSVPEIAAELDIPEESVKHLLYRARRALRRLLVGTSVEPGTDLEHCSTADLLLTRARSAGKGGALLLVLALLLAVPRIVGGDGEPVSSVAEPARPTASLLAPAVPSARASLGSPEPAGPATGEAHPPGRRSPAGGSGDVPAPPDAHVDLADPAGVPAAPAPASAAVALPQPRSGARLPAGSAVSPPEDLVASPAASSADSQNLTAESGSREPASAIQPTEAGVTMPWDQLSPRYSLSGAPVSSSEGDLRTSSVITDIDGTVRSETRFVAPTSDIDLTLNQTLIRRPDGSTRFLFNPVYGIPGSEVDTMVIRKEITVIHQNDGRILVLVDTVIADPALDRTALAGYANDPATAVPPVRAGLIPTRISATITFSADLATVLSETVQLS